MNPRKAYDKFFDNQKIFTYFFLLFIFLQFIFLLYQPLKFKIPDVLKNLVIVNFIDHPNIDTGNIFFKFPNQLDIEMISFIDEDLKKEISLHDLNIEFNSVFPTTIKDFVCVHVDKLNYFASETKSCFSLNNLELRNSGDQILVDLQIDYHSLFLDIKGDFNYKNLKKLIYKTKSSNKIRFDYQFIQTFLKSFQDVFKNNVFIGHYNCYFSLQKKLSLNIAQKDLAKKSSLTQGLQFSLLYDLFHNNFEHINLLINKIKFFSDKIDFNISNLRSCFRNIISNDGYNSLIDNYTKIQNIKFSGLLSGQFENLSMSLANQPGLLDANLFVDNNHSSCSNNIVYDFNNNTFLLNGNNEFIPHLSNLHISKSNDKIKFMDGEKLSISFRSSKTPIYSNYINNVHILANQLSVTESPPGDYEAFGFLDENVSVILDYVHGYMGDSIVSGKFSQRWNPLCYNFKIKGYSIPSDINSWLGDWWDKIWLDFKFSKQSIPFGYFNISGIWNVKSSNNTFGAIHGENLTYKGLPITKSLINLSVDSNKTRLSSSNILHKFGKLSGYLSIPRNDFTRTTPMTYSMSGVYPLNDGKMALGNIVEEYLNDFNVSTINIDSEGQFPISGTDRSKTTQIRKVYSANFSSSEKGCWNGIKFDEIKGNIKADNAQFDLKLPVVKMGEGLISVNLLSKFIEEIISLNVEIKNVKILDLYNSAISYQKTKGTEIFSDFNANTPTNTGLIDLSLNTSGNATDLMSFKGTGMIKLQDKQLSKVQLLGFISKGLSELPLPFPNGTLNFNKLEGLFELENGKILFDQLTLSGLLSKIVSKGHFDLMTGELDILSKIQIIGNIPIPIINQLANLTDPLSIFAEIRISGNWQDPKWKLSIIPLK